MFGNVRKTRMVLLCACALLCLLMCAIVVSTLLRVFPIKNKLVREELIHSDEVEVSPGKFVPYREYVMAWKPKYESFGAVHGLDWEEDEFYQRTIVVLEVSWKDEQLHWAGFGIPISIRSRENTLYMIVFDKETDCKRARFRYYRQVQGGFSEIPANDYPKQIATQNLWLKETDGVLADGTPVRPIDIARELDPNDVWFRRSLTAEVWHQLATGKEYYQNKRNVDKTFLEDYLRQYRVQKLDTIVVKRKGLKRGHH